MKKVQPDDSTVRLVDEILDYAVRELASDIHFDPYDGKMAVKIRVDGRLRTIQTVPCNQRERVVSRLKVMSGMDLTEHRKAQDGRTSLNARVDIRVSTLPTTQGEKIAIRVLDKSLRPHGVESLGIEGENLLRYNELISADDGLILIAGPTGSGKSSTMYEIITELIRGQVNVVTLEDPVEYTIAGANQALINKRAGMTFSFGMQSVLRQDPDVIAIGEIRDPETAEVAHRAAITGRLTLATVHAQSALSLPARMAKLGITGAMLDETLRGIIVQRLVRRVCDDCRGAGCAHCGNTGYRGRIGVFGILSFPDGKNMTAELLHGADAALADNCRDLITRGVTTESEVRRVLGHF